MSKKSIFKWVGWTVALVWAIGGWLYILSLDIPGYYLLKGILELLFQVFLGIYVFYGVRKVYRYFKKAKKNEAPNDVPD